MLRRQQLESIKTTKKTKIKTDHKNSYENKYQERKWPGLSLKNNNKENNQSYQKQ